MAKESIDGKMAENMKGSILTIKKVGSESTNGQTAEVINFFYFRLFKVDE